MRVQHKITKFIVDYLLFVLESGIFLFGYEIRLRIDLESAYAMFGTNTTVPQYVMFFLISLCL